MCMSINDHAAYTFTYKVGQKMIPLVQCNVMYEKYHFFWPTLYIGLHVQVRNHNQSALLITISDIYQMYNYFKNFLFSSSSNIEPLIFSVW